MVTLMYILTIPFSASSSVENGRGLLCIPFFLSATNFRMLDWAVTDNPGTLSNITAYPGILLYLTYAEESSNL